MIQAVQYCKCGKALQNLMIFLKQSDNQTIAESGLVCTECMKPVEIDLRKWGIKCEEDK